MDMVWEGVASVILPPGLVAPVGFAGAPPKRAGLGQQHGCARPIPCAFGFLGRSALDSPERSGPQPAARLPCSSSPCRVGCLPPAPHQPASLPPPPFRRQDLSCEQAPFLDASPVPSSFFASRVIHDDLIISMNLNTVAFCLPPLPSSPCYQSTVCNCSCL